MIPVHLGNSPLFFFLFLKKNRLLSFSPQSLLFFQIPIPPSSAPLVLLPGVKWRHVFPCTCMEEKGRKVKSDLSLSPPPFPRPPLPSLPAEESRQTGAEHGTFINPRQIAKTPLHTRWVCLQPGECGRQKTLSHRRVRDFYPRRCIPKFRAFKSYLCLVSNAGCRCFSCPMMLLGTSVM